MSHVMSYVFNDTDTVKYKNKLASKCLRSEVRRFLFYSPGHSVIVTAVSHVLLAYLPSGTTGAFAIDAGRT